MRTSCSSVRRPGSTRTSRASRSSEPPASCSRRSSGMSSASTAATSTSRNILKCRPPGNRDPQEDEIESCTPWLVEQISSIQPRVIVTLGNFATKFVLQTQQGITRMRGKAYPWHGRTVIPTFHPAAILHGGGEKSRQFGELREDFELVRDTLAAMDPGPRSCAGTRVVSGTRSGPCSPRPSGCRTPTSRRCPRSSSSCSDHAPRARDRYRRRNAGRRCGPRDAAAASRYRRPHRGSRSRQDDAGPRDRDEGWGWRITSRHRRSRW